MTATPPRPLMVITEHREHNPGRNSVTVAAAQLGGPWLGTQARLARAIEAIQVAAGAGATVVAFPETYLSGYPFWLSRTNGALFDDSDQKRCYAYYLDTSIEVDGPEQRELEHVATELGVTLLMGISERGTGQGRGTVWCTVLTIAPQRGLVGHHRKLVPTYDERLVWAAGDGAGLRTHEVGSATIGSLNCWENWMPQARTALYGQGQTVHFGLWPGSSALTGDITRHIGAEGRVFSIAASGLVTNDSIPDDFPLADHLRGASNELVFNGGSAVAGPDGNWIIPPVLDVEGLVVADLNLDRVSQERLNFDPTGHYARPDVLRTVVDRRRREAVTFSDRSLEEELGSVE